MNFIVVGCGRVGGMLASLLSTDQHNVTVIEKDPVKFENLATSFSGRRLTVAEVFAEALSKVRTIPQQTERRVINLNSAKKSQRSFPFGPAWPLVRVCGRIGTDLRGLGGGS